MSSNTSIKISNIAIAALSIIKERHNLSSYSESIMYLAHASVADFPEVMQELIREGAPRAQTQQVKEGASFHYATERGNWDVQAFSKPPSLPDFSPETSHVDKAGNLRISLEEMASLDSLLDGGVQLQPALEIIFDEALLKHFTTGKTMRIPKPRAKPKPKAKRKTQRKPKAKAKAAGGRSKRKASNIKTK